MKFDLTSPCDNCPFRSNVAPYLSVKRASGILHDILRLDKTFACHKTTSVGTGRRTLLRDHQHCAGALIMQARLKWPNWRVRLAIVFQLFDPRKLKMRSLVRTPEQFASQEILK